MDQPDRVVAQHPDRASWPCRYCHRRDSVFVTWRHLGTLVCFCAACEQGWCTDDRGRPRD